MEQNEIKSPEDQNEILINEGSSAGPKNEEPNISRSMETDHEDAVPMLETPLERRMRRKSHYIIYLTILNMSIGFSIVLTGVWPYLKELDPSASKEFLGWVIAANPIGQMAAAPLLGWCSNKVGSNRGAFIVTIAMFIVGNALYGLLPLFKHSVKYIMIVSRFIVGVSSANIALCRSYIAVSTKIRERTTAISITAAAQSLGFILGPSIQTLMAYAYEKASFDYYNGTAGMTANDSQISPSNIFGSSSSCLLFKDMDQGNIPLFNMYALASWFVSILGIFNISLYLPCIYKEYNISIKEAEMLSKTNTAESFKHDYVAIVVILITFFNILLVYVLMETLLVPMFLDMYAWTPEYAVKVAGIGLTIAGVITLLMFLLSGKLANLFSDRKIYILLGLIPLTFALLVFIPFGSNFPKMKRCDGHTSNHDTSNSSTVRLASEFLRELDIHDESLDCCHDYGCPPSQEWCLYTPIIEIPQFIVASVLTTLSYPVAVSLSHAIYSKLICPTSQGVWMGILTSAGSFSRVTGPILVTYMYTSSGLYITFGSLFSLLFLTLVLNCTAYKRLQHKPFLATEQVVPLHNGIAPGDQCAEA